MIGFQINGEFLDLPESPSVELNRNSPIFQQDGFVVEDYTLPITFPNTPRNARILNWPHLVDNAERQRPKWNCTLFYNGVPRLTGELRAKSPINSRVISANFIRGISQIGEDIKKRSIRDVVDDQIVIHSTDFQKSFKLEYDDTVSENQCALIINGTTYEGTDVTDLITVINADTEKTFTVSNPSGNILEITNNSTSEFNPFTIEEFTFASDTTLRSGTVTRRAVWKFVEVPAWVTSYNSLYQEWAADYIGNDSTKPFRLGTFYNRAREKEIPQFNQTVINYIDENGLRPNKIQTGLNSIFAEVFSGTSISPQVTVDHVLSKIEAYYGITIEAFFRNEYPDEPYVFISPMTIDQPLAFLVPYNPLPYFRSRYENSQRPKPSNLFNFYRRDFFLSEFLPDMTVNEILKALQTFFNCEMAFDNDSRILTYTNRKAFAQTRQYQDITDRCEPFTDLQNPILDGVNLKIPRAEKDTLDISTLTLTANPYTSYETGEGERPLELPISVLPTVDFSGTTVVFDSETLPKEVGAMEMEEDESFPLMVGIIHSYKSDIGLSENDLCRLTSITAVQNLTWYGAFNMFEKNWKDWVLLEDSLTTITCNWLMTREQAFNLAWGQRFRIDRNDYLLRDFNVTMRNNGLSMASCHFIRLPYFRDEEDPSITLAWRGVDSSLYCQRVLEDGIWKNSGMAAYAYLEEYVVESDLPTGKVKENKITDPDYIAPTSNTSMCPTSSPGSYTPQYLYITVSPKIIDDRHSISINNVKYGFPYNTDVGVGQVPYPYYMIEDRTVITITLNNISDQTEKWIIKAYIGSTLTRSMEFTITPDTHVQSGRSGRYFPKNPVRNITFDEANGELDNSNYNRIIITRELI